MANEKRLIDANELQSKLQGHHDFFVDGWGGFDKMSFATKCRVDEIDNCIAEIVNAPTVDAVSRGVHEQVKWERDVAIEQLESYGVSLGEKADVVKVVRCKDCKYYWKNVNTPGFDGKCTLVGDEDFCSDGERKDNERKAD